VHRGDIDDLESLRAGAAKADGVIHAAFHHDFSKFRESCEADRLIVEALGSALVGSNRPLIVTSGTALLAPGGLKTETDGALPSSVMPRAATEEAVLAAQNLGVNVSVVRLSPSVHNQERKGFASILMGVAQQSGVSAYIGDGRNRWPAVHVLDAARLFCLALEKALPGARYHGVGEEGLEVRQIAEVIGKRLNIPVKSITPDEAAEHFGWFAGPAMLDNATSSAQTREQLGWTPVHPGLLADLEQGTVFQY
jgi:nucleoside-diphosphate-sugar epimerase